MRWPLGPCVSVAVWVALSSASSETVRTDAPCSPVVEGTRGNVTINFTGGCTQGFSPAQLQQVVNDVLNKRTVPLESFQELSQRFGVSDMAVTTFLRILGERKIPIEDLDSKLREIAARHLTLLKQIESLPGEDPHVETLKKDAVEAIRAGNYPRAEVLLYQAFDADLVAARKAQDAANRRFVTAAKTKADLGQIKLSQLQYEAAAREFQAAADLVPATETRVRAQYLSAAGEASYEAGMYPAAESALFEALKIRMSAADFSGMPRIIGNLALVYQVQGRYAEAERLQRDLLAMFEKALGPAHPTVATSLNNLAALYETQGRYAEAESLHKRALANREKALGPEHIDVAHSLNNLAVLYSAQNRPADAEPLSKRALVIYEKVLGAEHPTVATGLNNLAEVYRVQNRYSEAEPLHKRALANREKTLGPEHPHVAISLNNLSVLYRAQGRYAEAETLNKRALAIDEKAFGPEHPDVAGDVNNLGLLYQAQGRYADAEPLFRRALAIREKMLGLEHPNTEAVRRNLKALQQSRTPPANSSRGQ